MTIPYEFKDIVENENLDISMNFQYQNRLGKVYSYNLYPLWNCGVSVLGITTHTFSHDPFLVWYDNNQTNYTPLPYEKWKIWTSIINQMVNKKAKLSELGCSPFYCLPDGHLLENGKLISSLRDKLYNLKKELPFEIVDIATQKQKYYLVLGTNEIDGAEFKQIMLELASQYNQPTLVMKEGSDNEICVLHIAELQKEPLGQFTPDKLIDYLENTENYEA